MQFARKFGIVLVLAAMALFIVAQFGSCKRNNAGSTNTEKTTTPANSASYEPKFRHDGNAWITSAETSDTLADLPLEIVRTDADRQFGMMYRKSFNPNFYGMLFIMDDERLQSFWMRNTYVGLDILYVNSNREIVSIVQNAQPLNDAQLRSEGPAKFVLEIPAGFSMKYGIKSGDKLHWKELN